MAAVARSISRTSTPSRSHGSPLRLVVDAPAAPSVRLRLWELEDVDTRRYRPVAHGGVELSWVEEGSVGYVIGGERIDVGARSAVLVPSDVEHETVFSTPMRGAAVWVDRDVVAEVSDALGRREAPPMGLVAGDGGARVAALGAVLAAEVRSGERGSLLAADALVEAMLVVALRGGSGAPASRTAAPRDPAIAAAVRFIEESYAEPVTVDAMARAARMSRFHFSRRFRDATGASPYQFLTDVRMERAAELLRRGRHGVTEAAMSVGLSDPGRFARTFRARFGVAPGAYAAEVRSRVTVGLPPSAPAPLAPLTAARAE